MPRKGARRAGEGREGARREGERAGEGSEEGEGRKGTFEEIWSQFLKICFFLYFKSFFLYLKFLEIADFRFFLYFNHFFSIP